MSELSTVSRKFYDQTEQYSQSVIREETPPAIGYLAIAMAGGIISSPDIALYSTSYVIPPEVTTGLATTTYLADIHKLK